MAINPKFTNTNTNKSAKPMAQSGSATSSNINSGQNRQVFSGGAAVIAPAAAFSQGVPPGALVVLPITKPKTELIDNLQKGPIIITPEQMWDLLGFNGPAVQVQDENGRPVSIGLDDLIPEQQKRWNQNPQDINLGRSFANILMNYGRFEQAEKVIEKLASLPSAAGEDWQALGMVQAQLQKLDKSEESLKRAQQLMPKSPMPILLLAQLSKMRGDSAAERSLIEKAISTDPESVEAWGSLFESIIAVEGESRATTEIETMAKKPEFQKSVAPYFAMQMYYSRDPNDPKTREKAKQWAKKANARNATDVLSLLSLTAIYSQEGDIERIVKLLQPHEAKMINDARLANAYIDALFQAHRIEELSQLLGVLAKSPNQTVRELAATKTQAVTQILQQQQQQLLASTMR
ncbi:MAG: hypothetical protein JW841_15025 [Deltaproteobacteria bacterium]|nr:hypothetical protein [Deltaproteobacteria bacterium]